VEQVGPPKDIYENPATAYVADFLGVSNLMDAEASGPVAEGCAVKLGDFDLTAGQGEPDLRGPCKVTIRPERIDIEPQGTSGQNRIPAMIERVVYVGATLQIIVHLASGETIQAWVPNDGDAQSRGSGDAIVAHFPVDALRVLAVGGTAVLEAAELEVASDS
jgi:spermidine/putrescine transport system ATP-binding protein